MRKIKDCKCLGYNYQPPPPKSKAHLPAPRGMLLRAGQHARLRSQSSNKWDRPRKGSAQRSRRRKQMALTMWAEPEQGKGRGSKTTRRGQGQQSKIVFLSKELETLKPLDKRDWEKTQKCKSLRLNGVPYRDTKEYIEPGMLVHTFDPGTWEAEAEACRSLEYHTNLVYTRACSFCFFFFNKSTPTPHTVNNSAGKFSNLDDMCRLLEKTNSPSMHKMKQKKGVFWYWGKN